MKLFAMVTTRPSDRYTSYALRSFFEHTPLAPGDRFILIDNDNYYQDPTFKDRIELLVNQAQLGFAQNANQMITLALRENADLYFLNNDIILTPAWLDPFESNSADILTPLSNREVQYKTEVFKAEMIMSLEDYLAQESGLSQLVESHRRATTGYLKVTALPFFCVKLPLAVMQAIGYFDESFGKGGAEDYDYCLRAYLAGFAVKYALPSFVLHFGGKSSWSGVETREQQDARELLFRATFGMKWGMPLMKLLLFEDRSIIPEGGELWNKIKQGQHREVIESLIEPLRAEK